LLDQDLPSFSIFFLGKRISLFVLDDFSEIVSQNFVVFWLGRLEPPCLCHREHALLLEGTWLLEQTVVKLRQNHHTNAVTSFRLVFQIF
jgi:hypothetical protein